MSDGVAIENVSLIYRPLWARRVAAPQCANVVCGKSSAMASDWVAYMIRYDVSLKQMYARHHGPGAGNICTFSAGKAGIYQGSEIAIGSATCRNAVLESRRFVAYVFARERRQFRSWLLFLQKR